MNADDLYRRGREAMECGALDEAVGFFHGSIAVWPHFKTLELLGECLLRLARPREAIVPLAAATALNRQAHSAALLAQAFLVQAQYREAFDFAEVALARDPGSAQALEVRQAARRYLES